MKQTNTKDIHFFLSSIGGIGKSSLSLMAAETLDAKIYDAYIAREFLSSFDGVDTFGRSMVDTDATLFKHIDMIMDKTVKEHFNVESPDFESAKSVVVDVDASLTFAFMRYIETGGFIEAFSEYVGGGKCYLHFVYSPESAVRSGSDMELFSKRSDFFSEKSVILWINEYKEAFLTEDEISDLTNKMKSMFGDSFLNVFHIPKNEAIKPLFRKNIYEPKHGIFKAYQSMNLFDKAKMRSYTNFIASMFEDSGFNPKRLDINKKVSPFASTNIAKEVATLNVGTSIKEEIKKKVEINEESDAYFNDEADNTEDSQKEEKSGTDEVESASSSEANNYDESNKQISDDLIDIDDINIEEEEKSKKSDTISEKTHEVSVDAEEYDEDDAEEYDEDEYDEDDAEEYDEDKD